MNAPWGREDMKSSMSRRSKTGALSQEGEGDGRGSVRGRVEYARSGELMEEPATEGAGGREVRSVSIEEAADLLPKRYARNCLVRSLWEEDVWEDEEATGT